MTQYGSSSDRPRGRRARHGSDAQDWAGSDSAQQEDREFPDLAPIRPQQARASDARQGNPAGYGGRHSAAPSAGGPPSAGGAPSADAPSAGGGQYAGGRHSGGGRYAGGQSADGGQYGGGQYGSGQYGGGQYPGGGQYAGGQPAGSGQAHAPWDTGASSPSLSAPPLAEPQAAPQAGRHSAPQSAVPDGPRGGRLRGGRPKAGGRAQQEPQRSAWDDDADSDDPMAAFSERWRTRGEETRADQADRNRRRRLYYAAGGGVLVIVVALVAYFTIGGGGASNTGIGDLVTTFLPGELQQVPNACSSVSSSTISQDLPGKQTMASPPMNTGAQSQCTWTLDNAPTYRVLEVNVTAYSPSGLASGDGSATFAAEDAYQQAQQAKSNPSSGSDQPKGTVANISGLGSSAFSSMQVFNQEGSVTDMATVYVRYRNVLVQVVLNGLDKSGTGKSYGPVSQSTLLSQAQTIARQVTSKVTSS